MQWYYTIKGQQLGPVSEAELREKIGQQEVRADDLVWADGMGDWQPVAKTPALSTALVGFGQPANPQQPSPYHPPAAQGGPGGMPIPTYLWQSIVVTLFCCQIFGIIAIVFAAKVDGLQRAGDIAGARQASETAKKWCWWGFGSGLLVIVIYIALIATGTIVDS